MEDFIVTKLNRCTWSVILRRPRSGPRRMHGRPKSASPISECL